MVEGVKPVENSNLLQAGEDEHKMSSKGSGRPGWEAGSK